MNKTEFSHIETLENAVKWDYFKGTLAWDDDKIAYEMCQHPRRLSEWVNQRATTITNLLKADKGRVKSIRKKLVEEYPPNTGETKRDIRKRQKIEKLEIRTVVREFNKGRSLKELATKFKIDFNDFRIWWNRNLQVINQQVKQLRNE